MAEWSEIRGGSGALLAKIDRARMVLSLWDRRAGGPFLVDLTEEALEFAAYELARRREAAARSSTGEGAEATAGPHGKII